ncbi:3-hydroxyacyl-CoA dehydrogenase family protein [Streptomyces phaeochromogenes]|uniref:3-hydroxyacyl-CoA dehydrogenase family protein n=1 Tax=Streptomyces phaeochromogenes TaxID=1923 RepID=UPI003691D985
MVAAAQVEQDLGDRGHPRGELGEVGRGHPGLGDLARQRLPQVGQQPAGVPLREEAGVDAEGLGQFQQDRHGERPGVVLHLVDEDPGAILATNTSSLPIMRLGMATRRADRVVGLHFFNPVPVLPLVEIVASLHTAPGTVEAVEDFATRVLGKTVVHARDRAGFVVNALLIPYVLTAVRMAESGFATATDIDAGMELGCAHPMGPLKLADLIGLDTVASIAESLYDEFREPLYAPPPLLQRMVEAGLLGRKTGRGFHVYDAVRSQAFDVRQPGN